MRDYGAPACTVARRDDSIPYGWKQCEEPPVVHLNGYTRVNVEDSVQGVFHLCIEHAEQARAGGAEL